MTRIEALSLAIARHFEPEPTHNSGELVSALGWYSYHRYGHPRFRPRRITEPEIAMRLLKTLVVKDLDWMVMAASLMLARSNEDGKQHIEQYEQAIAEAAAKALNLEVE